jgi:hypothetical protein
LFKGENEKKVVDVRLTFPVIQENSAPVLTDELESIQGLLEKEQKNFEEVKEKQEISNDDSSLSLGSVFTAEECLFNENIEFRFFPAESRFILFSSFDFYEEKIW